MAERAGSPADPLELTLFSRRNCPLCDEMRLELARWDAGRDAYRLTVVDIDSDPALARRYGLRIPVLASGSRELCAGRFRETALDALATF